MEAIKTQVTQQNMFFNVHHSVTLFSPFFTVRFENSLAFALL